MGVIRRQSTTDASRRRTAAAATRRYSSQKGGGDRRGNGGGQLQQQGERSSQNQEWSFGGRGVLGDWECLVKDPLDGRTYYVRGGRHQGRLLRRLRNSAFLSARVRVRRQGAGRVDEKKVEEEMKKVGGGGGRV
jgi:hypothetical protein